MKKDAFIRQEMEDGAIGEAGAVAQERAVAELWHPPENAMHQFHLTEAHIVKDEAWNTPRVIHNLVQTTPWILGL